MLKKNFNKKFLSLVLSITDRIESVFNFFKKKFSITKFLKHSDSVEKKFFFSVVIILFIITSYFLIPSFYDKNKIKKHLENQIFEKYNLRVELDESLKYGLFPSPHFFSKNTQINYNSKNIGFSEKNKIYISLGNFFFSDQINIKDLIFKQTNFKINNLSFRFFIDLFNNNENERYIKFINSKFFYLDQYDNTIFLINFKKLNYHFKENIIKEVISKFDIFNIPASFKLKHSEKDKDFFIELDSHDLRLNIKNKFNYIDKEIDGKIDITFINDKKKIDFNLINNHFTFQTDDNQIFGDVSIKPFYLKSKLNLYEIDLKKTFNNDSFLLNALKSEIFNNENLNGKIDFKINNFKKLNFLKKIKFSFLFEEGNIYIQNFQAIFKNSTIINLNKAQIILKDNNAKISGDFFLEFTDIDTLYSHYQVNKAYRKKYEKINIGFLFDLDTKLVEIDNLLIDNKTNKNIDQFVKNLNSSKEDILNRIIFKNTIKNFFKVISLD